MTLRVVANAGPLMVFSKLNLLPLMKELYGHVDFPYSVYQEIVIAGIHRGFSDAHTLNLFLTENQWKPAGIVEIPADLQAVNLDRGEKEAIALALLNDALLLIDEERARDFARQKGLATRGSLGILIQAFRKELINERQLRFYFKQIGKRKDIWISPNLCARLLEKLLKPDDFK